MRYAIFSDVHNNDRALSQVLRDTYQRNIDTYLCLGDTGTDPSVQLVRGVNAESVFGNWEVSGWRHLSPQLQQDVLNLPPIFLYFSTDTPTSKLCGRSRQIMTSKHLGCKN